MSYLHQSHYCSYLVKFGLGLGEMLKVDYGYLIYVAGLLKFARETLSQKLVYSWKKAYVQIMVIYIKIKI